MPTPQKKKKMTDHYGTIDLQILTNLKLLFHNAMWNCSINVTLKFKTSNNKKKRKKKVRNNNNKNILFSQRLHVAMCKTQLKPKWDFTRKPPPIKNILFKICCQKSTRTENKEPPKLVYLLLWGNQFICYCGMLRTDSRWRILSSSSAFLKK